MANKKALAKLLSAGYNKPIYHWTERDRLGDIAAYGLTTNPEKNKYVGNQSFEERSSNLNYGRHGLRFGEFNKRPLYFFTDENSWPPVHLHDPVGVQVNLPDATAAKIPAGVHTSDPNYNVEVFLPDVSNWSDEELIQYYGLPSSIIKKSKNGLTKMGLQDRNAMFGNSEVGNLPEILLFDDVSKDWLSTYEIPEDIKRAYFKAIEEE